MSQTTVTASREIRYWRLRSSPQHYRILDAIQELETDLWEVAKGTDIRPGDRVLIWKVKGKDPMCGLAALGEVVDEKKWLSDADNRYWLDGGKGGGHAWRVRVRYVRPQTPLMWMDGPVGALTKALNIGRAPVAPRIKLSAGEWEAILAAIGGWPA